MNDKDQIKDLFSEKLGNFEAKVSPELWANVASQVGATTGAAAAGGGISFLAKTIIGISGAAMLTVGVVLWSDSSADKEPTTSSKQEITKVQNTDNSDKTLVSDPIATTSDTINVTNTVATTADNTSTTTVGQEPILSTPISIANVNDRRAIEPDPEVTPTPQVVLTSAIDSEDQSTVSKEKENDIIELSNEHNLGKDDDPVQQVSPLQEDNRVIADEVEIVFPNVFTPDGDGRNDRYYIVNSEEVEFKSFEFVVYNRSGSPVMVTKDPGFKWTAFDPQTGMYLEKGVYVFVMIGESTNGVQHKKSGTITIE